MNGQNQQLTLEEAHLVLQRQASTIAQLNYDNNLLNVRLDAAIEHIQASEAQNKDAEAPAKSAPKGK